MTEKKVFTKKNFNKNGKKPQQKKNATTPVIRPDAVGPFYEYSMSKEAIADTLRDRKGPDAKKNPQQYLCEFVTEQCGLLGTCVKVYGV